MSTVSQFLDRPGALIGVSIVLAIVLGLLTSSLLGFGIFLFLPSVVMWLARRCPSRLPAGRIRWRR
ncbi:MAG: hypothetical protein QOK16_2188 [Solirubrobacteraceae bacterium]|jgi:hypothetical protein|nr:hypothetical protein [Solirubrobacteraceae bacterium]